MIDLAERAQEIIGRYPPGRSRSALLPLLHLAQQRDGYLTQQGIDEVGSILTLSPAEVTAVATFYTMLHRSRKGRRVVSVCHNIACTLSGAEEVISAIENELGIKCGTTTADGAITLERAECLARCDLAPMMQVDYDEMIGPLTTSGALRTVAALRQSQPQATEEEPLLIDEISLSQQEQELLHREEDR